MPSRKTSAGIIPLIILIIIGVVVAVGGVYIVRNQFIKTSPVEQAKLDLGKIQEQIENPQELSEFTPAPEAKLATGPVVIEPENVENSETSRPGFSITPPFGWERGQVEGLEFGFLAPEKDEEKLDSGLVYRLPPSIQVAFTKIPENTFANINEMMDDFMTKTGEQEVLSSEKTTLSGEEVYLVFIRTRLPEGVWFNFLSYNFYKNGYYVVVGGSSLESTWTKNSGIIQSSLETFKFTD